jgi:hypothetical protein
VCLKLIEGCFFWVFSPHIKLSQLMSHIKKEKEKEKEKGGV